MSYHSFDLKVYIIRGRHTVGPRGKARLVFRETLKATRVYLDKRQKYRVKLCIFRILIQMKFIFSFIIHLRQLYFILRSLVTAILSSPISIYGSQSRICSNIKNWFGDDFINNCLVTISRKMTLKILFSIFKI